MLIHTLQIRQGHPKAQQTSLACCCTFDPSLSRSAHHRPCPLSVQRLPLWNSHSLHILRKEPVDPTPERDSVCHPSLPKAHLPVSGSCIFCLSSKCLLSGIKADFPDSVCQLPKTGCLASDGFWDCIRALHLPAASSAATVTLVSILAGLVSRLLGAQYLGTLLIRRQSPYSTYVQSSSCALWSLTKAFCVVAPRLHLPVNDSAVNSATRGLVGESAFAVLPDITPRTTTFITLLFQLVSQHYLLNSHIPAKPYCISASSHCSLPLSLPLNLSPGPTPNSLDFFPSHLPRPRKSHRYAPIDCFSTFNTIANLPPRLSSPSPRRPRIPLPAPLPRAGAPHQNCLHDILDHRYLCRV